MHLCAGHLPAWTAGQICLETSYPDASEGHERFWFSYTRIFVPETQHARNYQMAGNTGDYDGRYGEAPEGAFENFQVGVLYRTEEGWRCDGTGTGSINVPQVKERPLGRLFTIQSTAK